MFLKGLFLCRYAVASVGFFLVVLSEKLSCNGFNYWSHWSFESKYLCWPSLNLQLPLTFCQAAINRSPTFDLLVQRLSAGRTDYCGGVLRPGQSPRRCSPLTGAKAGARGCTGLCAPLCDNTDQPRRHTWQLGSLITALQRKPVCVCCIDLPKDSSSAPAGLPSKPSGSLGV